MTTAVIFTKTTCPYCVAAKDLLEHKGIPYTERNVDTDINDRVSWRELGRDTVPQIVIDGMHVGGCDDLYRAASLGQV